MSEPVPVLVGDAEVTRYARRLEDERDRYKEALERALDYLENNYGGALPEYDQAVTEARSALSQPYLEER